jgi:hypothetical protein
VNDFEAAADKARLTGQIRSFMTWLGDGRKLTQTGRIGLADARHLVELLDTGDRIDPEIGDRIFKTRSSEQLPYLTRVEAWMKAARLIRVTRRTTRPGSPIWAGGRSAVCAAWRSPAIRCCRCESR